MSSANIAPNSSPPGEQTLLPALLTVFQGLTFHPPGAEAEEYRQYRGKIQKIMEALEAYPRMPDAQLHADSAVRLWTDYGQRMVRRQETQTRELRAIIQVLLDALDQLSVARPERMQQLKEIGKKLGSANSAEELRVGRAGLSECLEEVRSEAERRVSEVRDGESRDGVTLLSNRAAAESALVAACGLDTSVCAVAMRLARLSFYNRRYGRDVGDRVLRFFAEFLTRSFESAKVYRWTGPGLVLLMPGHPDQVTGEVRRHMDGKLRCEVEAGSRHIMLPIEAEWSVFPMMVEPRLLINRIDAFSAG